MKKCLICCLLCLIAQSAKTQSLTQSAEGKGAIILPLNGLAVGFDIGKTEIAVGVNNYSKALSTNNESLFHNWFIGADLTVKNSSGIGNLFNTGDIVPAGKLQGFLGFNINNNKSILKEWNATGMPPVLNKLEQERLNELFTAYRSDVFKYAEASLPMIKDDDLRNTKGNDILKKISESPDNRKLLQVIASILDDKDEGLKAFIWSFKLLQEPREREYVLSYSRDDAGKASKDAYNKFVDNNTVKRLTPFIFAGIDARNFSIFNGLNLESLQESFIDTLSRGGHIGLGINAQYGSHWLGITYSYIDGDNFIGLDSKEYILRTSDTNSNQTLISEEKITGYSGTYGKVKSTQLHIDYIKEFRLGDTSRLITNIYYRGSLASEDTDLLKNYSNVGLGLYFLGSKSKFLGGLYVELPDINNNIEKAKPETDRNIRPPFKKLTFGVVTKFSLNTIMGFLIRPS